MVKYENLCVGCPQGCISCGRKHVPVIYCDECGAEIEEGDIYDEYHLCEDCKRELNDK